MPTFICVGSTYLPFKKGDIVYPRNYRYTTCLSVMYKLFTAMINKDIYRYCENNKIISPFQKDLLRDQGDAKIFCVLISLNPRKQEHKRNLSVGYMDFTKPMIKCIITAW